MRLTDTSDIWGRYAFRGARVLLDRLDGRVAELVDAQAVPTGAEAVEWAREGLDGYVNFVFRAAKSRRGDRDATPVWLWSSRTGASPSDVDRAWQAFLRRFDLEHTFRLYKQTGPGGRRPSEQLRKRPRHIGSEAGGQPCAGVACLDLLRITTSEQVAHPAEGQVQRGDGGENGDQPVRRPIQDRDEPVGVGRRYGGEQSAEHGGLRKCLEGPPAGGGSAAYLATPLSLLQSTLLGVREARAETDDPQAAAPDNCWRNHIDRGCDSQVAGEAVTDVHSRLV